MVRIKNETYPPVTVQLSSIEVEEVLSALDMHRPPGQLLKEAKSDVQMRLLAIKDRADPKPRYEHLASIKD